MAYVDATVADLLDAFPEFTTADAARVDFWLERARAEVDRSWLERDYTFAQVLLAAHYLTIAGIGDTPEARAVADGSSEFKAMRVGSLSLERFDKGGAGTFLATRYGRMFQKLLRANKGGPRVTGQGSTLGADGDRSQAPTYPWGAP